VLPDFTPTSIPSLEETLKGWLAAAWGEMREGQWAGMGEEEWCPQTCSAEGDRKEEEGEAREEVVSLASQRIRGTDHVFSIWPLAAHQAGALLLLSSVPHGPSIITSRQHPIVVTWGLGAQ
jgi:hypothetical protein